MSLFKKTNVKIFAKSAAKVTPDTIYWRQLGIPVTLKEFGPIDYIDFSPTEHNYFAVTCSVKVQIYNPLTKLVHKTISRFRENAFGANYRSDGQLLCVGGEETHIKLFDVNSKSLLRVFKGHTAPVRRCFFTMDNTHIASFSDDKTVAVWDIPTEKRIYSFNEHGDYIRAGAVSPVSPTTILSGSYDKKLSLFDTRTRSDPIYTVDHGHPVESAIFLPSGSIFISAGGNELRVWDCLAGGKLLARVVQHHKTITALSLASYGTRLLSASLDRHVKFYDISTYQVVHNLNFPSAVLSLGVSKNDDILVAGTIDGLVSVSARELKDDSIVETKPRGHRKMFSYCSDKYTPLPNLDEVIVVDKKQVTSKYDNFLRKYQHARALDCVLMPFIMNRMPHVTVSVLQELIRRKVLVSLLQKGEERTLVILLKFMLHHIGDIRFTTTLVDVSHIILDGYGDSLKEASPVMLELFKKLLGRLHEEESLTEDLTKLGGCVTMLLSAAIVQWDIPKAACRLHPLIPSANAQQTFIIVIE